MARRCSITGSAASSACARTCAARARRCSLSSPSIRRAMPSVRCWSRATTSTPGRCSAPIARASPGSPGTTRTCRGTSPPCASAISTRMGGWSMSKPSSPRWTRSPAIRSSRPVASWSSAPTARAGGTTTPGVAARRSISAAWTSSSPGRSGRWEPATTARSTTAPSWASTPRRAPTASARSTWPPARLPRWTCRTAISPGYRCTAARPMRWPPRPSGRPR